MRWLVRDASCSHWPRQSPGACLVVWRTVSSTSNIQNGPGATSSDCDKWYGTLNTPCHELKSEFSEFAKVLHHPARMRSEGRCHRCHRSIIAWNLGRRFAALCAPGTSWFWISRGKKCRSWNLHQWNFGLQSSSDEKLAASKIRFARLKDSGSFRELTTWKLILSTLFAAFWEGLVRFNWLHWIKWVIVLFRKSSFLCQVTVAD